MQSRVNFISQLTRRSTSWITTSKLFYIYAALVRYTYCLHSAFLRLRYAMCVFFSNILCRFPAETPASSQWRHIQYVIGQFVILNNWTGRIPYQKWSHSVWLLSSLGQNLKIFNWPVSAGCGAEHISNDSLPSFSVEVDVLTAWHKNLFWYL